MVFEISDGEGTVLETMSRSALLTAVVVGLVTWSTPLKRFQTTNGARIADLEALFKATITEYRTFPVEDPT